MNAEPSALWSINGVTLKDVRDEFGLKGMGKGAEIMNKFPHTSEVTVQSLGYQPVKVYVRINASGEVYASANFEGEKRLCVAKEEKKRPEFYVPGMRFRRTGHEDDEYVLVSGGLFDMYKSNYAMLVNVATGNNWWSAAKVVNHAKITREEFDKIVNCCTDEFELIEKEPKT